MSNEEFCLALHQNRVLSFKTLFLFTALDCS
jgi:hypothetical protein